MSSPVTCDGVDDGGDDGAEMVLHSGSSQGKAMAVQQAAEEQREQGCASVGTTQGRPPEVVGGTPYAEVASS